MFVVLTANVLLAIALLIPKLNSPMSVLAVLAIVDQTAIVLQVRKSQTVDAAVELHVLVLIVTVMGTKQRNVIVITKRLAVFNL